MTAEYSGSPLKQRLFANGPRLLEDEDDDEDEYELLPPKPADARVSAPREETSTQEAFF